MKLLNVVTCVSVGHYDVSDSHLPLIQSVFYRVSHCKIKHSKLKRKAQCIYALHPFILKACPTDMTPSHVDYSIFKNLPVSTCQYSWCSMYVSVLHSGVNEKAVVSDI